MNAKTAPQTHLDLLQTDAFEFVQALAAELSTSKIDLPSFPDVAVRVRRALADERTTVEQIVRIVGSEPALAARLLKMANSAALNWGGKPLTEIRTAVARMGSNMVRTAALSFAMAQIRASERLEGIEKPLDELWRRSTYVAASCYVLARKQGLLNPDEAFLAGMLHGVGRLYVLARAEYHRALFADPLVLEEVMRDWHASIGKAILENWDMNEAIVAAVAEQDDVEREHEGPADLADLLICANIMCTHMDRPAALELAMQGVNACRMLGLDAADVTRIVSESREQIEALRQALDV
ncbi:MAG: HDOD domain-containing protein [Steroidobacteraceae bacterium]|jgi:HD-like signal output (HDOD) protein|nr:HDOD domain-containing protein [Steroidobacteraceae bacterium]